MSERIRQPAAFATCAAEPCDLDATVEVLHDPSDDLAATWVPICDQHLAGIPGYGLAYVVEVHGFVPPVNREAT